MNHRGAALIVALLALLIAGAIASAALATGHARWRAGLSQGAASRTSLEVQSALERHLVQWGNHRFDSLPEGAMQEIGRSEGDVARRHDSIVRLGPFLFQLKSVAEVGVPGQVPVGRDAAAVLVRLAPLELIDSAVVISPTLQVQGSARVDGTDHVPTGWETRCSATGPAISPHLAESDPFARFRHDPRLVLHPTSGMDSVTVLQGGQQMVDGMGSGILWATGSLELSGDSHFAGVMLVEGSLRLRDRARVDGVVVAESLVSVQDMAEISHSSCAVRLVLERNPVVPRLVQGGWWRID